VWVLTGRFPAVASNSTREIAGVRTATVLATPDGDPNGALLAVAEEIFHVFWLARHPAFRSDEMARYDYPIGDVDFLRRLLAEDEALARALDAETEAESAAWAALALEIRRERTTGLAQNVTSYETALESMEGTANYVARRAAGESPARTAQRLREKRQPEAIRWRFYDTGAALCWILDRLAPDWKVRSESSPERSPESILEGVLAGRRVPSMRFSESELASFGKSASAASADLAARMEGLRKEIAGRAGWRVVIEVPEGAGPLRLQRFDPVHLVVLDGGEVIHPHFVTVGGPGGSVALTNPGFARGSSAGTVVVSASAGRRPMGEGFRRLTVVGIPGSPEVDREGKVTVKAPGLDVEFEKAEVILDGETVRIRASG
jgi:hypothetical protein